MCSPWTTLSRAANSSMASVPWVVTVGPVRVAWARMVVPCFVTVASRRVTASAPLVRMRKRTITPSAGAGEVTGSPASFGLM